MSGWGPTERWVTQEHVGAWRSDNLEHEEVLRKLILAGRIGIVAYGGSGQVYDTLTPEMINNMLGNTRLTLVEEAA